MATIDPIRLAAIISELTNSLQSALLLAARLEPDTRQAARDAGDLHAAVSRAATVVHQLRPDAKDKA